MSFDPDDDPVQRPPEITLAGTLLDWQPTVSLEDGLKKSISYFNEVIC